MRLKQSRRRLVTSALMAGAAGAILLVAGCSVRQPSEPVMPPSIEVPDTWAAQSEAKAQDLPAGWLADFGDPRLEAIVAEALENNQDLQTAAAQLEVARQAAVKAGAGLYPFISAGAGGSSEGGYEGGDTTTTSGVSLDVVWEVDLWGGIRAGKAAGLADYQAAGSQYAFARLSLAAQTAKAWFLAVENKMQVGLAEQNIELFERNLALAQARYNAGMTSELDVHLARFQLAQGEDFLRKIRAAYEQAVRSLEVLLGRYPDAEMELAAELAVVPPPVAAGIPAEILEQRPDLVAAERRVAAAFYTIQVAQAARLPSLALTGSAGTASSDLRDAIGAPDPFWNLAAGLFAPIFAGGELKANVEIATSQQKAALHQYVQAVLQAFNEVETTLSNDEYLREAERFQEIAVHEIAGGLRQALVQYDFGLIDFTNILLIQQNSVAVQRELLDLRNRRLANRINLYLSLGVDESISTGRVTAASPGSGER
jgi:NodT family efflux transporter outer membrane factor (OMF) lipoprotein